MQKRKIRQAKIVVPPDWQVAMWDKDRPVAWVRPDGKVVTLVAYKDRISD